MIRYVTSLGYAGAYLDPVTRSLPLGNGYRVYMPHLMRFAAPDGMSPFLRGGLNPYVYCLDDPINRVDPSGHFPLTGDEEIVEQAMQSEVRATSTESIAAQEAVQTSTQDGASTSRTPHPSTGPTDSSGSIVRIRSRSPIHAQSARAATVPMPATSASLEGIVDSTDAVKLDRQMAANARSPLLEAERNFKQIARSVLSIQSDWARGEQPANLQAPVQIELGRVRLGRARLTRFSRTLRDVGSAEDKQRLDVLESSLAQYSQYLAQMRAALFDPLLQPGDLMAPPN